MWRNVWNWHLPPLCIQDVTCIRDWTVQSYRQVTCPIWLINHAFQAYSGINYNPSFCHCYFLAKWLSPVKTWRSTVQHQRPQTIHPWKYWGLLKCFLPLSRQIFQGASRGWTLKHHWYISKSLSNRFRPPIKPSGEIIMRDHPDSKTPLTLILDTCQYYWGSDWTLWQF